MNNKTNKLKPHYKEKIKKTSLVRDRIKVHFAEEERALELR